MKFTSLMCALAAGMAMSAAASAEPGAKQAGASATGARAKAPVAPQFAASDVAPQHLGVLRAIGQKHVQNDQVVRGPLELTLFDAIGDCAGFSRIVNDVTLLQSPAALFDDGSFTPGPGTVTGGLITEMDVLVWPQDVLPEIVMRVTIFDTVTPADPIVQSVEIFSETYVITGTAANTTPGLYIFTLDVGDFTISDDNWGIEIAFLDAVGGNYLETGITTAFPGAACNGIQPSVGSSQGIWWFDGDNYPAIPFGNGVRYEPFDPDTGLGDAFAWGATGPANSLAYTMRGIPTTPPVPTGACCVAGACVIRTMDDCMTEGGTYQGDDTNCTGTFAYTASSAPFASIPDFVDPTPGSVSDSIVIGTGEVITDLDVGIVIDHTWQGDVTVTLTHVESATTVTLIDRPGFSGTGFGFDANNYGDTNTNAPFILDDAAELVYDTPVAQMANVTGRWKPDLGPLSAFNGINSTGTWTLTVTDSVAGDTGFIFEWGIAVNDPNDLCPAGPAFCDADWCQNGTRDVSDIFCFLADWFALDNDARTYGGAATPVQAIFAWLAVWFATPNGPCP